MLEVFREGEKEDPALGNWGEKQAAYMIAPAVHAPASLSTTVTGMLAAFLTTQVLFQSFFPIPDLSNSWSAERLKEI